MRPVQTISHYRIISELGRGGMGIVYKAEDTKLHRSVALKVLSAHLLSSEDDRARFYREARAAAQLNHPNIATVYAVDEILDDRGDPNPFIAMEYVEGRTLREVIDDGPLKLDDAIRIASEIASALHAAHEKDIVHRDVKSANVMLTETGSVKVLDFGLAKTAQSTMLTKTGSTLGTAAYMSPEQASTGNVDRRTDIWSLGVVLYEMIAGKLPFGAAYEQAVVYSILNEDPEPLTAVRTGVPVELERIVTKCLMKDPKLRYQHADELAVDLRAMDVSASRMSRVSATRPLATGIARRARWKQALLLSLLAGLILGGVATSSLIWNLSGADTAAPRASRLTITVPFEQVLRQDRDLPLAISPDGRQFVLVVDRVDGPSQLYLRSLDDFEAVPLPGTEDGIQPFFSPDGQWVGFWADGALQKVSVKGGGAIRIGDIPIGFRGASWGSEDTIILGGVNTGLSRISAGGGPPVVITNPDKDRGGYHAWPEMLPGGREVLFYIAEGETPGIGIVSLETGQWRILPEMQGAKQPRYLDSGHLVFARGGDLFVTRFDVGAGMPLGSSTPVLNGINTRFNAGTALVDFAVSRSGSLAYLSAAKKENQIVFVDRQGGQRPRATEQGNLLYRPALSPDGEQLAISYSTSYFESSDVWILDLGRGTLTPLTTGREASIRPVWTPDGSQIVFASFKSGSFNLYRKPADGSAEAELLLRRAYGQFPESWSPDGKILTFNEANPNSGRDIWMLHRDGVQAPETLVVTPFNESSSAFSVDGRWLAYESDASGRYEVYVQPFPGPGRRSPVSVNGGYEPVWSPDGKELFYHTSDSMMVVKIETDPVFKSSVPSALFAWRFQPDGPGGEYDVTPDGRQFVMVKRNQETFVEVNVILNWVEELERMVPAE